MSRVFPARGSNENGPTRRRSAAGHSRAGGAANSLDRRWYSWPPFPRTGGRRWRSRSPPSPRRRSHSRAGRGADPSAASVGSRCPAIPARARSSAWPHPGRIPVQGHSRARGAATLGLTCRRVCRAIHARGAGCGAVIGGAWRPAMSRRRARRLAFSTMPLRLIVKELSYGELFDVAMLHRIVKQFLNPPGGASWPWRQNILIKIINSIYYMSSQWGEDGERKTFSQAPAGVRRKYLLRF